MLLVKKLISQFVLPLSISIFFLLTGLIALWFGRHKKAGTLYTFVGAGLLVLFSFHGFPDLILGSLENRYPRYANNHHAMKPAGGESILFVIVLGGGSCASDDGKGGDTKQLNADSMVRLMEGLRIQRLHQGSKLVFSGGKVLNDPAVSEIMKNVAIGLGVATDQIIVENQAADTESAIASLCRIIGQQPHILVTSAYHMPRAMMLSQRAGLHPIPAPTDYRVKRNRVGEIGSFFPYASNIEKIELAAHEYQGMLWVALKEKLPFN